VRIGSGVCNELYELFSGSDMVKTIKIGRLRWTGHVIRKLDDNPIKKKLTLVKPDGYRRVGRQKLRWTDGTEIDLRMLRVRGSRRRAVDRRKWKNVLEAAMEQTGLYSH
jgi:hypothetical protein